MSRGKGKLERWAKNKDLACVHEPDLRGIARGETYRQGTWRSEVFAGGGPLTLELGCGQGLFSVNLARHRPEESFIGIDVKGHRFWRGAKTADAEGLSNIAFLRARVQWLDHFFAPGEVRDVWLTFTDPQVGDKRGTKRLTSPYYLRLYQSVMEIGGRILVKTDSPDFYERTLEDAPIAGLRILDQCDDVHGASDGRFPDETTRALAFITAYEERWIEEGRRVHYVELEKTADVPEDLLVEARAMLQGPKDRDRPRYHGAPKGGGRREPAKPFGLGVVDAD